MCLRFASLNLSPGLPFLSIYYSTYQFFLFESHMKQMSFECRNAVNSLLHHQVLLWTCVRLMCESAVTVSLHPRLKVVGLGHWHVWKPRILMKNLQCLPTEPPWNPIFNLLLTCKSVWVPQLTLTVPVHQEYILRSSSETNTTAEYILSAKWSPKTTGWVTSSNGSNLKSPDNLQWFFTQLLIYIMNSSK